MADAWGRELAKEANGDMLQYFKDNPEKLKEKQERDAKKEKKAGLGNAVSKAGGWAVKNPGKALGVVAGAGAVAGAADTLRTGIPIAREEMRKVKKAGLAEEGSKLIGKAGKLWVKHGPEVKRVAGKAGQAAQNTVKRIGEGIGKIENPVSRGAAAGATVGGIAGAIQGGISPDRDPYTGQKKRLKTMLSKGVAGAATGAATGGITGAMHKSSSVSRLEAAMTKRAAGVGIPSLGAVAKNFVASAKPIAQKAMSAATPHVQAGVKALKGSSMGQAAGVGAAAGGAMGGLKGLVAPGKDAQGNTKSRIGGALKGTVSGAAGGAALGAGAKAMSMKLPGGK